MVFLTKSYSMLLQHKACIVSFCDNVLSFNKFDTGHYKLALYLYI